MVSFVQSSFHGGEVSQSFQGRIDRDDYRTFMNVCHNALPIESGALLPRPGTRHLAPTRGGTAGMLISFSFKESHPYNAELTDGFLRFHTGNTLVKTNDAQTIVSVSAASPAVVTTAGTHGWSTGNAAMFKELVGGAQLQNRQVKITSTGATTFSIADALTGLAIDGSAIDTLVSGTVERVLEIATPYTGTSWERVRSVQAEKTAVLLNGAQPQILSVDLDPGPSQFATFALASSNFLDGPYLDPIPGSWVTASALSGVVTLTFSFQPYSSAIAYNVGDYVSDGGVNYRSLTAANQNHTPASSGSHWVVVNAGDPINDGAGFTSADIGRLVRLFSEPGLWNVASTYSAGDKVSYDDGSGTNAYWKAIGSISAGTEPGTSTNWVPLVPGAKWTWGRITAVSAAGVVSPNSTFGSMTLGGSTAAAFDGNTTKASTASPTAANGTTAFPQWAPISYPAGTVVYYAGIFYQHVAVDVPNDALAPPANPAEWTAVTAAADFTTTGYVGGQYTVAVAVHSVTAFPTTDIQFHNGVAVIINLRAKATLPSSATDGTLLGTSGQFSDSAAPVTILSNDTTSTWNYIWLEMNAAFFQPLFDDGSHVFTGYVSTAQMVIYSPNIANGSVVTAQIVGDAMLYSGVMRKWRLGVYGGENGWPTCGTYHRGRLWLAGVVDNRADGSKAGDKFNFAPTAPDGTVAADNAISATFDGPDVNAIFWMEPDQQGIICGTQAGEWLLAPTAPGGFTPTTTGADRVTSIGCANIEPVRTEHTLAFVQKHGRKIMEYFADVYSGKLSAPNLTMKAKHLTVGGVAEIAYQQELAPVIWYRTGEGALRGITYKREKLASQLEPDICGAHRHTLGSGRTVASIAVGPSADGNLDSLALITNDPATGIHHVEVMADLLDEGFVLADAWLLDDAIHPTSCSVVVADVDLPYGGLKLNGLWAHNGREVTAFIAGLDCGEFTVADGTITVPFGDGVPGGASAALFTEAVVSAISASFDAAVIPMCVGFSYTKQGQIVRPAQQIESGTRAGPGQFKERRVHRSGAQLYGAINGDLAFGTDFNTLRPVKLTTAGGTKYTPLQPWSGIYRDQIGDVSGFDGMVCWQSSRPLPWMVIAIGPSLQTQDG